MTFATRGEAVTLARAFDTDTPCMPRSNRGSIPAGVYHVWRRSAGPTPMFVTDLDRTVFCNRTEISMRKYGWTCGAFVLMKTHFHLVVEVDDDVLSAAMHSLFAPYAQDFNRRTGRSGHLRGGPFKLRRLEHNRDVRVVARYVARNPVEARVCERPQDWIWSSYPDSVGYARRFAFIDARVILGAFHDDESKARDLLRDFVEEP